MATTNYILTSNGNFISEDELYHHGIKGQKWGVRRYQNEDGSLTAAGKKRADIRRPDDIIIKKGTQLNNLGSKEKLKLRGNWKLGVIGAPGVGAVIYPKKRTDNEKKLFVYKEDDSHDKDVYEGAFTQYIKYRDRTNRIFKQKFENIDDIVSPSAQRRAELFVEAYRNNPKLYSKILNRTDSYMQYRQNSGVNLSPGLKSFVGKSTYDKNTSDSDLMKYGYGLFNIGNEWTDRVTVKGNNETNKLGDLLITSNNINIVTGRITLLSKDDK